MMIHPCYCEQNLPAAQYDQITQAVILSRLIKTGKESKFSTKW